MVHTLCKKRFPRLLTVRYSSSFSFFILGNRDIYHTAPSHQRRDVSFPTLLRTVAS